MKKSTLTKIICLAVLCLMVLPLVMACGKAHTIYFDANGGTGSMSDQIFTYGKKQTSRKNRFTRDGYIFGGWYTDAAFKGERIDYIPFGSVNPVKVYAKMKAKNNLK